MDPLSQAAAAADAAAATPPEVPQPPVAEDPLSVLGGSDLPTLPDRRPDNAAHAQQHAPSSSSASTPVPPVRVSAAARLRELTAATAAKTLQFVDSVGINPSLSSSMNGGQPGRPVLDGPDASPAPASASASSARIGEALTDQQLNELVVKQSDQLERYKNKIKDLVKAYKAIASENAAITNVVKQITPFEDLKDPEGILLHFDSQKQIVEVRS